MVCHITEDTISSERSLNTSMKDIFHQEKPRKNVTFPSEIQRLLLSEDRSFKRNEIIEKMKENFPQKYKNLSKKEFENRIDVELSRLIGKGLIKKLREGIYSHGAYNTTKSKNKIKPNIVDSILLDIKNSKEPFSRYKFEVTNGLRFSKRFKLKKYEKIFLKEINGWKSKDKIPSYRKVGKRFIRAGLSKINEVYFKNTDRLDGVTYLDFPIRMTTIISFLDKFDTWFKTDFLNYLEKN